MPSKAITETPEADTPPNEWKPFREVAPSMVRADEPTVPRWIGTIGLGLALLGGGILIAYGGAKVTTRLGALGSVFMGPYGGTLLFVIGIAGMLYHAARDSDLQVRRLYAYLGFLWLAAAVLMACWPAPAGTGAYFLPYGFPSLILALVFLMPVARNETETKWHQGIVALIGLVGLACAGPG